MKETRQIMGMPVTVEIKDRSCEQNDFDAVFNWFREVDERFSPYKPTSELSQLNRGEGENELSSDMQTVLKLCQETKRLTGGYFDIEHNGILDPSGLVKGWAIARAARILADRGFKHYYVEAGGDIQTGGGPWTVGIRNPYDLGQIIKIVRLSGQAIATSGTYIRGQHIYNPLNGQAVDSLKSLSVIADDIYEADRLATAAFAMGRNGINFLAQRLDLAAYQIDNYKNATLTSGFATYAA